MRLLHLSDLHFSKISFALSDIFSKRFLGTLNLLLKRKRGFVQDPLEPFLSFIDSMKIDALLITGDLSSTSLELEFLQAHNFLREIQKKKIPIFLLPGNHDMYTKEAFLKKSFYKSFGSFCDFSTLPSQGVSVHSLDEKWKLVCLDCAKATSLFSSRGTFSKQVEAKLESCLRSLRQDFVLIALHFPFSDTLSPRRSLEGRERLKKLLLKHPQVKIVLHGHTHRNSMDDLRSKQLPIVVGVGSLTKKNDSSFRLLETSSSSCDISLYTYEKGIWKSKKMNNFVFKHEGSR
jgi:3',5'-cyclic AMP phosphodiesterase CpdA